MTEHIITVHAQYVINFLLGALAFIMGLSLARDGINSERSLSWPWALSLGFAAAFSLFIGLGLMIFSVANFVTHEERALPEAPAIVEQPK